MKTALYNIFAKPAMVEGQVGIRVFAVLTFVGNRLNVVLVELVRRRSHHYY